MLQLFPDLDFVVKADRPLLLIRSYHVTDYMHIL